MFKRVRVLVAGEQHVGILQQLVAEHVADRVVLLEVKCVNVRLKLAHDSVSQLAKSIINFNSTCINVQKAFK